jgi:hypothetical protein
VSFLSALKRELDLGDMEVREGRAEQLIAQVQSLAGTFDVVVTRAVGTRLVRIGMEYLRPGGVLIAGGPPTPSSAPFPQGPWSVRLEEFVFSDLGLSRRFMVGRKAALNITRDLE